MFFSRFLVTITQIQDRRYREIRGKTWFTVVEEESRRRRRLESAKSPSIVRKRVGMHGSLLPRCKEQDLRVSMNLHELAIHGRIIAHQLRLSYVYRG